MQRFGLRIGRGWTVLFLLIASLVVASYWLGPLRELPPELELLAVDDTVAVQEVALTGTPAPEGGLRFPLALAVRNLGPQDGLPTELALSVPAHLRVVTRTGDVLGEVSPGVPLRRYVMPVHSRPLTPGNIAHRMPGLDTVWIEAQMPQWYCTTQGGPVPEFVPAPRHDPRTLSDVKLFYSISMKDDAFRNTGTLVLHLNQQQLESAPVAMPPSFPVTFQEPAASAPELGALREIGKRTTLCGDPEQPLELLSVQWRTADAGNFFAIYFDGAERKRLFDMNGDDVIELETWDGDGDGQFEARREARYATPSFLKPVDTLDETLLAPDTAPPNPAFVALFEMAHLGPWRFARPPQPDTTAGVDSTGVVAADTAVAPPDPAWLRLFDDTAAGPFRFTRQPPAPVDTAPAPRQAPREPSRPRPLGTPIPYPRPDTIR